MKPLCVASMGEVDDQTRASVETGLRSVFGVPLMRMELPDPEFALNAERRQYGSIEILRYLNEQRPPDAGKLLGLTARDLFIPMLTFVYGQAQVNGRAAVVSLARLRQEFYGMPADAEMLAVRARKEALHETGHLFGLVHCSDPRCAMLLATSIGALDAKPADLCPRCTQLARKRVDGEGREA